MKKTTGKSTYPNKFIAPNGTNNQKGVTNGLHPNLV